MNVIGLFVGSSHCLRPEDIGNQARLLLVEFIRQRMVSAGSETAITEDQLISPDSPTGCIMHTSDCFLCTLIFTCNCCNVVSD